MQRTDLDALLKWAYAREASDVFLMSDEPVIVREQGSFRRVSQRRLTVPEIADLLNSINAANSSARVGGGDPVDFAYEVKKNRLETLRFRACASGGMTPLNADGIEIVFRTIQSIPPTLAEIDVEPALISAHQDLAQSQGMALVIGATGTGKTTLLAAMMRDVIEHMDRRVVTFESPIEFALTAIPNRRGVVIQSDVPRHARSFAAAVSNVLRRAPNIILIGEMRDRETMAGAVQAALTGHAVYSTVHANSVAAALPRIVGEFPFDERRGILARLLDVLRLMVTQRLVPGVDGRRVALREYLVLTQAMRKTLAHADLERLQPLLHEFVEQEGQSLLSDARRKADRLAPGVIELIEAEWSI
jgi:defect-in-organelle-trafficking protein DotB